jgi:hypothetical protein
MRKIISELKHPLTTRPSLELVPLWERGLLMVLISDGVDNLVGARWVFHPKMPCQANSLQVVVDLLQDDIDPSCWRRASVDCDEENIFRKTSMFTLHFHGKSV